MTRQNLRDLAICLSLANICFIDIWAQLFSLRSPRSYFFDASSSDFVAAMLDVILLGMALWFIVLLARRYGSARVNRFGKWLFLLILLIPLNILRQMSALRVTTLVARIQAASWYSLGLVLIAGIGLTYMLARWQSHMTRVAVAVILALTAFVGLTFARGLWTLAKVRPQFAFASLPLAPTIAQPDGVPGAGRVVILLFDEMDSRLAFRDRPAGFVLPEFDRLRGEGFYAANAHPPGSDTEISMPSLITGRVVSRATPAGPDDLMLAFKDDSVLVPWSTQPNMFSEARLLGINSALTGWYHPYCRVLHATLVRCFWEPYLDVDLEGQRRTLLDGMREQLLSLSPWNDREQYVARYLAIMANSAAMLQDSTVRLALLHVPVPHPPAIYDRKTRTFTVNNYHPRGYFDNLALADRALGELRATLEASGTWSRTNLLVTSDHWLRSSTQIDGKTDHRVPFILKLANRTDGLTYARPFNTVLTRDLVLAMLRGEVRTSQQVARWLDQRASTNANHRDNGELDCCQALTLRP